MLRICLTNLSQQWPSDYAFNLNAFLLEKSDLQNRWPGPFMDSCSVIR